MDAASRFRESEVWRKGPRVGAFFFFSSRRRHTRLTCDWSSDVCSSDLVLARCRERKIFLPVNFAVHIAVATLDALAYAHAARGPTGMHLHIVHCDVSPSDRKSVV